MRQIDHHIVGGAGGSSRFADVLAQRVWDIRKRLQWCNVQVRANELPPDAAEYDALELYLKSLSQGMPLMAPNIRH